jgi:hypothetical protein
MLVEDDAAARPLQQLRQSGHALLDRFPAHGGAIGADLTCTRA